MIKLSEKKEMKKKCEGGVRGRETWGRMLKKKKEKRNILVNEAVGKEKRKHQVISYAIIY